MNDEVKKIIGEIYKGLPFDVKKAIVSGETRQQVQAIADRHHLLYEQVADLETETALVMLGLRPPADFITNVKGALNLPEEKARAIAEHINTEIFRPVRESLKKIHNISETPPPIPPIPVVPKPLPIRDDSNRGSSILQDKIGTVPPPPKPELTSITLPVALASIKELPPPEDETKLNREEILRDIENPVPVPIRVDSNRGSSILQDKIGTKPTSNIVQNKLEGMVRMPHSVEEIKEPPPYVTDPYREPLK